MVSVSLSWETGTVDDGLAEPLKPSFSENKNSWTPPKNPYRSDCLEGKVSKSQCWPESIGKQYVGTSIHSLSVEKVDWAKDGDYVLKVFGKGWDEGTKGAMRSELSALEPEYFFHNGDYHYYTMNFWPDESWDQVDKWSTCITQWKMGGGYPYAVLRFSNEGDYKVFFRHYKDDYIDLGVANRKAWNEVKVFFKKSVSSDGFVKVWLNKQLVWEYEGKIITKMGDGRSNTKFGMYTNIMGERTLYFDAVSFCHSPRREECLAGRTLEQWVANENSPSSPSPQLSSTTNPPVQTTTSSSVEAMSPAPASFPAPASGGTVDSTWSMTEDSKVGCRQSGTRLDSPASVDACQAQATAEGKNAFNARFKDGSLRTCYFLFCEQWEVSEKMRSVPPTTTSTWQAHLLAPLSVASA